MAKRCPLCNKKSMTATKRKLLRGHYNPTKKHRQNPNLQWAKVPTDKGEKRMKICTNCMKSLTKVK